MEQQLDRGKLAAALDLSKQRVALASCWLLEPHILHIMGRLALSQYSWALWGNRGPTYRPVRLPTYY